MYSNLKKSLFLVGIVSLIILGQPISAMEDDQIRVKLNTARVKIKTYPPLSEYPWETEPTVQTQGILRATIQGRSFDFCHTNYLGITKLKSEIIQKKCGLKVPVDYIPYPNININNTYEVNEDVWFQ